MLPDVGASLRAGPETASPSDPSDAYRDLHRLLPDTPSFSRILRRMMTEAQGTIAAPPLEDKRTLRNAARKARRQKRAGLALFLAVRAA